MFGHGSPIGAHNSFGRQPEERSSPVKRPEFQTRLKTYNDFYDGSTLQLKSKHVNGRAILEGPLRIHWRVISPIHFKQKDEIAPAPPKEWRKSCSVTSVVAAAQNGIDEEFLQHLHNGDQLRPLRSDKEEKSEDSQTDEHRPRRQELIAKYNTIAFRGEKKRHRVSRRWSMINGHVYDVDTSSFTPSHGSVTTVTITSLDSTPEVVKMLLAKFKVTNNPSDFCLCTVRKTGEIRMLDDVAYPLLERVQMGPLEEESKIFIIEKNRVHTVSEQVAQYINLPEAVLKGFLSKFDEEEEREIDQVKTLYAQYKQELEKRLAEISTQM